MDVKQESYLVFERQAAKHALHVRIPRREGVSRRVGNRGPVRGESRRITRGEDSSLRMGGEEVVNIRTGRTDAHESASG